MYACYVQSADGDNPWNAQCKAGIGALHDSPQIGRTILGFHPRKCAKCGLTDRPRMAGPISALTVPKEGHKAWIKGNFPELELFQQRIHCWNSDGQKDPLPLSDSFLGPCSQCSSEVCTGQSTDSTN